MRVPAAGSHEWVAAAEAHPKGRRRWSLAAAGTFGDASIDHHVLKFQADALVIGTPADLLQEEGVPDGDPFLTTTSDRGGRTSRISDTSVGGNEHQGLDLGCRRSLDSESMAP